MTHWAVNSYTAIVIAASVLLAGAGGVLRTIYSLVCDCVVQSNVANLLRCCLLSESHWPHVGCLQRACAVTLDRRTRAATAVHKPGSLKSLQAACRALMFNHVACSYQCNAGSLELLSARVSSNRRLTHVTRLLLRICMKNTAKDPLSFLNTISVQNMVHVP